MIVKDMPALRTEIARLREECARLEAENSRLRQENLRLQERTDSAIIQPRQPVQLELLAPSDAAAITRHSSNDEKLALFRGLFRGRDDVYAVRWEYPNGRSGYSPSSRSRLDRERGVFLPLTDQVVREHLLGRATIGVYPLLRDETCWFLAADFDKERWPEDAAAYLAACAAYGVPAALERSRSGNGAHVWIFFESPVSASQARKLGCLLLTEAMEQRHQIGLDSYDRLFPNQDTLPRGGFGNLIALPLQREPLRQGNSAFLDSNFDPYSDQWDFLSSVRRLQPSAVDRIVGRAAKAEDILGVRPSAIDPNSEDDPWTLPPSGKRSESLVAGPFPSSVRVTVANLVYVAKEGLQPAMLNRLWRLAAFQNPEFYRAQAMRLSTFGKPRVISCAEEFERYIGLPRGCSDDVRETLEAHGVRVELVDERISGAPIDVAFHGELRPPQGKAVEAILAYDVGVMCAPTAFGKTVIAAWLIASRRVNTLVLVHRRHLLDQWREQLAVFLSLPSKEIGQIGGGRNQPSFRIDVALLQSLGHQGSVDDVVARYGQVIVDECHHVPAFSFERVLKAVKARFVLGLTATPIRKDGHHPIVVMQCGPIRFRVSAAEEATRPFTQLLIPRATGFRPPDEAVTIGIQTLYAALTANERRNDLICADLLRILGEGRTPLLLTERTAHLDEFARRLVGRVPHLVILRGGMGVRQRRAIAEELRTIPEGEPRAILATGRYAGEGFDYAELDTLLLALPISWRGTLQQYVGRLNRVHPDKRDVRVYDYVDSDVPVLARMYAKRLRSYRALGYVIDA